MDAETFLKLLEKLHSDTDCTKCPRSIKKRCDELYKDQDGLCSMVIYAKFDLEVDEKQASEATKNRKTTDVQG